MRCAKWIVGLALAALVGELMAARPAEVDYSDFAGRFKGTGGMDLMFVEPPPGQSFTLPLAGKMVSVSRVKSSGRQAIFRLTGTFDVVPNSDGISADRPIPVALGFTLQKNRIKITELKLAGQSLLAGTISGTAKTHQLTISVKGSQVIQLVPLPGLNLAGAAQASFKGTVKIAGNKTHDTFTVTIPDLGQGVSLTANCHFDGKAK